ncbi:uncharacterized protein LOC118757068 [Rhagoletis pomonella]|uniref:uncharacterized protein LOC118757068 n=1 Tax=Rhagoletis pomonella TaxID=28610 RepID=UPI001786392D|nr:uncharacterized protein LOC118757068 [Rhagoletis pomonella]
MPDENGVSKTSPADHISQPPAQSTGTQPAREATELAKVSVKIPPFWHAKPELWLAKVESQFIAAGITNDKTKYHTVVAAMESNVLAQISDIILNPPSSDMYQTLKERLITQFADSEQIRVKKLLQELELGDMRPSHLLREMRSLSGNEINDGILKSIWMSRLPSNIRSVISISTEPLDKVALLADKVSEVSDIPQIRAIETQPAASQTFSHIERQLAAITKEIAALKTNRNYRHRSRSRGHSSERTSSRQKTEDQCWYHMTFGNEAKKCRKPCSKNLN